MLSILVLEKTLESPLDSKKIKPVNPKGSQLWIFIGTTDAEAPILWPPDMKSWLTGKDPDAGKECGQEEKGVIEDETVEWHHRLNGHDWANSGRRWRTQKRGMLQFMGSQQVGHDLATEQQQSRVYGICDFSTRNLNSSSELYVIKWLWLCYDC